MKGANLFLGSAVAFGAIALFVRGRPPQDDSTLAPYDVIAPAGGRVRSAGFAGRVQVINFWASWCAPCREELPKLDSLAATWDTARAVVVALSDDVDGAAAREFLTAFGRMPHLRIGLGLGALKPRYRYPGLPYTMLVDRSGTIVRRWYGYGGPPQLQAIDSLVGALAR